MKFQTEKESFSKLLEKGSKDAIGTFRWCPTMDLIAVVTAETQLELHRLSWQKVWSLPPSHSPITSLCWRPDGKVLAVGSADGTVSLHEVENGEELHRHSVVPSVVHSVIAGVGGEGVDDVPNNAVVSLEWMAIDIASGKDDSSSPSLEDRVDDFLPDCPPLPESNADLGVVPLATIKRTLENTTDPNQSNVLVVGTATGVVSLFALGALNIGSVDLAAELTTDGNGPSITLAHATLSKDIATLTAVFDVTARTTSAGSESESKSESDTGGGGRRLMRQFSTLLISERKRELHGIALQCSHITALIKYLEALIKCMETSWESILLELNTKLTTFAQNSQGVEPLSLEVEFMALLTSGIQSPELEGFLSRELSTRKLKTMGAAVEAAYGRIRKLVLEHMNQVTQALMFRIGDLEGLACWEERFGAVGLDVSAVQQCTTLLGSFALKSAELLNAIDESKSNFKAFFAWLQRVMWIIENDVGQVAPFEFDTAQVAQFIQNNFSSMLSSKEDGEAMVDVVGQYFAVDNLRTTAKKDGAGSSGNGLWGCLFGEIVLDCPAGGCHAQVMKTIEVDSDEGVGPGKLKNQLRGEGISSEAVDDAVEWLLAKGHLIVTGRGYLAMAAGPGQTQHTHLYPDMTSSSLAQVLADLQAAMEASFSLTSAKCRDSFSLQTGVDLSAGGGGDGVGAAAAAATVPSALQAVKVEEMSELATISLSSSAANRLMVVKVDGGGAVQAAAVKFSESVNVFAIQSYNDENFALMMTAPSSLSDDARDADDDGGSGTDYVLALLPIAAFEEHYEPVPEDGSVANVVAGQDGCDGHNAITEWTNLGDEACTMAVGGARQVGCTLAPNKRGLKIFDLGVGPDSDDEDEDEEDDADEVVVVEEEGDEDEVEEEGAAAAAVDGDGDAVVNAEEDGEDN